MGSFAQELAQRAAFPRRYGMHAGIPALRPAYMQAPSGEVDVVPAQCHQLRGPETMAVSDQDSRGVPMARAVVLGGLDEALDLPVGEIFTAALANCYIYRGWSRSAKLRVFHGNSPPAFWYCYRSIRCNRPGWMFKPAPPRLMPGARRGSRKQVSSASRLRAYVREYLCWDTYGARRDICGRHTDGCAEQGFRTRRQP